MKLCRRHIQEIYEASGYLSLEPIDWKGDIGNIPIRIEVSEDECEDWTHKKLIDSLKMLDELIEYSREQRDTNEFAAQYIDAYQTVRRNMFGSTKP